MAERARLSAPQPEAPKTRLPVQHIILPVSTFLKGERRLEAENYLVGGYGTRLQLEAHPGITRFGTLASAWQPSRLKGIQVGRTYGTPFLAATQVYDVRPVPRKFLALEQTDSVEQRFLKAGEIVVTCSGTVGRVTMAHEAHEGILISHDLLRVAPIDPKLRGWLFAYLRTSHANSMMTGAQYGHIIKHLETQHLEALPIPLPSYQYINSFELGAQRLTALRSEAHSCQLEAEDEYQQALGGDLQPSYSHNGFSVPVSRLTNRRRRIDATHHAPFGLELTQRLSELGFRTERLGDLTTAIYLMPRIKRVFAESGQPYLSADEVFSLNPQPSKFIAEEQTESPESFRVKDGWLLMARSGQVYGLNGSVMMASQRNEAFFISDDLIRLLPNEELVGAGYLLTALSHPKLGRPLVIKHAYGTSIPHLEPEDVAEILVPRLDQVSEGKIDSLTRKAVDLRRQADELEVSLTNKAEALMTAFLRGDKGDFQVPS